MQIATLIGDQVAGNYVHAPRHGAWRPFLLGVAVSAVMWGVLGAVTTLSVHAPVAEVLGIALTR